MATPVLNVALYTLIAAVATGLGALPFFWVKKMSIKFIGSCNAAAAGLMLGASIDLIYQGVIETLWRTLLGLFVGFLFIIAAKLALKQAKGFEPEQLLNAGFQQMLLIVVIMTVHSFAEGVSEGFSFAHSAGFGFLIVLAMGVQNVPEGLAISAALCPKGVSPLRAAWWSVFSSLPQVIMAVPAFIFVQRFRPYLPIGLGFAAGAMIWLIFTELIPEAKADTRIGKWLPIVVASVSIMTVLGLFIH